MSDAAAGTARSSRARGVLLVLLVAAYAAVVAVVTLRPERVDTGVRGSLDELFAFTRAHGLAWFDYALVEWLSNVALFVPAGILLALLLPGRRRWRAVAGAVVIGAAVSAGIELSQFLFLPDRVPSWADVAANTLGTAIGAVVVAVLSVVAVRWVHRGGAGGRRDRVERGT